MNILHALPFHETNQSDPLAQHISCLYNIRDPSHPTHPPFYKTHYTCISQICLIGGSRGAISTPQLLNLDESLNSCLVRIMELHNGVDLLKIQIAYGDNLSKERTFKLSSLSSQFVGPIVEVQCPRVDPWFFFFSPSFLKVILFCVIYNLNFRHFK